MHMICVKELEHKNSVLSLNPFKFIFGPHGVHTARATQEPAREDQFPTQAPSLCILFRSWLKVKIRARFKRF